MKANVRMRNAVLVTFLTLMAWAAPARAEHFEIELTVQTPREKVTSHSDTSPPPQGLNPRPACHAKRGEDLVLQFFFTSNFPHGTKKNVGVHYFIQRQHRPGDKPIEPADRDFLSGKLVMNFKPDGRAGLRQQFHIDVPGAYLVRVESDQSDSDHEHFSALDLIVD
jgi:hypothetical protein